MTQWYYAQEGRQAGPVDDATFRQWITEGRIGPGCLIWREGMPQWQPAATVPGLFEASAPPVGYDAETALAEIPTGGTGGRADVGRIFGRAWRLLWKNFPVLLGAVLLVTLINSVPNFIQYAVLPHLREPETFTTYTLLFHGFNLAWAIFITMPLGLGICALGLRAVCNQPVKVSDVFSGFRIYGKAVGLQLWMMLLVILWSLLLIVPGIIAALRYSQALYLMTYRPKLGIRQAVKTSGEMMYGHKGRLFVLYILLVLIGIAIFIPLCILMGVMIAMSGMQPGASPEPVFFLLMWTVMMLISIPLAMFSWMIFAEFHRDLTQPGVPVTSSE